MSQLNQNVRRKSGTGTHTKAYTLNWLCSPDTVHTVSPPIQLCQNILKSVVAEGHEATRRLSQSLCPDSPDSWPLPPRGAKSCLVLPAGGRPGPLRRGPPGCSGGVTRRGRAPPFLRGSPAPQRKPAPGRRRRAGPQEPGP